MSIDDQEADLATRLAEAETERDRLRAATSADAKPDQTLLDLIDVEQVIDLVESKIELLAEYKLDYPQDYCPSDVHRMYDEIEELNRLLTALTQIREHAEPQSRQAGGTVPGSGTRGNDDKLPSVTIAVQPQTWVNNYAVDAGPEVIFDITPLLVQCSATRRQRIRNDFEAATEHGDHLYLKAAEMGLVQSGFGPFYVTRPDPDQLDALEQALEKASRCQTQNDPDSL